MATSFSTRAGGSFLHINKWFYWGSTVAMGLLAAAASYAVLDAVYCGATITTDEASYAFQSQTFASGKLKRDAPPLVDEMSRVMNIVDPDVGWLSRYPFAHPLWLAPGAAIGAPRVMVALATVLSVVAFALVGSALGLPRFLLPIISVLSAFFIGMNATLLSHTTGLLAVVLMLWAYIRWQQSRRIVFAIMSGLCWGWFFNNRTYTAALICVPFGIDALAQLRLSNWRTYLPQIAFFAGSATTGLVAYMAYNYLTVGNPLTATYLFYDPSNTIGFGERNGALHTLAGGLANAGRNLVELDRWLYGFRYSAIAVGLLALIGLPGRWGALLLSAPLALGLGYVAFWFPGVVEAGPVYYFEGLAFIFPLSGIGLWRVGRLLPPRLRIVVGMVVAIAVCMSGYRFLRHQAEHQTLAQVPKRQAMDLVASAPGDAVIVFHEKRRLVHECGPNLDGLASRPMVLLHSTKLLNPQWEVYAEQFPGRPLFAMAWGPEPKLVPADVPDRIDIVPSIDILARQTGRNIYVDGRERMVRHVRAGDSAGWALFGGYFRLPQGHYAVTFTYSLAECPPEEPVTFEVMGDWGARELASAIVYGTHTNGEAVLTFEAEALMVFEPRVHYGGAGTLKIYELQIREAASGLGD